MQPDFSEIINDLADKLADKELSKDKILEILRAVFNPYPSKPQDKFATGIDRANTLPSF